MRSSHSRAFTPILIIACVLGFPAQDAGAQPPAASRRMRPFAELSASPLLGIDKPIKGFSLNLLVGLGFAPFEAGIRAGGAYDSALGTGSARIDLMPGLGRGLRAIIGGCLLFNESALRSAGGDEALLSARVADWPNRFGIAATLAETSWRPFGAELGVETEIVYTAYRLKARTALSGAAAFAAGVEAKVALRLRWGHP